MKQKELAIWIKHVSGIRKWFPFGPLQRKFNAEGRLHGKPAYISPTRVMDYENGKQHGIDATLFGSVHYYYEGIMVPPRFITDPKSLNIGDVIKIPNAEVRYAGLKIYGYDRIEEEGLFELLSEDAGYKMYRFKESGLTEPLFFLRCINSTPELNGTYKTYFLCVPSNMKSCKEAVAWTFRANKEEYKPTIET